MASSEARGERERRSTNVYYIIEHPKKGVLKSITGTGEAPIPHFSWLMSRKSSKAVRFSHLADAIKLCDELYNRSPKRYALLRIRRAPRFYFRCWECLGWVNDHTNTYGEQWGHRQGCPLK